MAFKGPTYGMSAEVKTKIMHKYSVEVERNVREWLQAQLGVVIDEYEWPYGGNGIHLYLKDGTILRYMINRFNPGAIAEPKKKYVGEFAKTKQREMIEIVMREAGKLGVKNQSMFDVNDLYEQRNMTQVLEFIVAFGGAVQALPNFSGPTLGVKPSEENRRHFTDEEIKSARDSQVSMQAGSNKFASMAGTRVGMPRHIADVTGAPE
ncbi:calponin-1-like [Symsagittifera roscoffensis]|uniref:calponin-1-like n=1 Tax=Symsagittifera roscoffensis TaxID=84072 RepID=UPI00307C272D